MNFKKVGSRPLPSHVPAPVSKVGAPIAELVPRDLPRVGKSRVPEHKLEVEVFGTAEKGARLTRMLDSRGQVEATQVDSWAGDKSSTYFARSGSGGRVTSDTSVDWATRQEVKVEDTDGDGRADQVLSTRWGVNSSVRGARDTNRDGLLDTEDTYQID